MHCRILNPTIPTSCSIHSPVGQLLACVQSDTIDLDITSREDSDIDSIGRRISTWTSHASLTEQMAMLMRTKILILQLSDDAAEMSTSPWSRCP